MGRWFEWKISADLDGAEIAVVKAAVGRVVMANLAGIVDDIDASRPPDIPANVKGLIDAFDRGHRAYVATDPITLGTDRVSVSPSETRYETADVGFSAGTYAAPCLGMQDYALMGVLGVVATETGKLSLGDCDDLDQETLDTLLRRFTARSGYAFKGMALPTERA